MKRVLCVISALALSACSSGGPQLGPHLATAKPAAMTKPAPRVPLTLSIAGVRFDALTRAQALVQLEKRGFTMIKKSQSCDKLAAPQNFDRAASLVACWYGRRWAFTRLQWTSGSGPTRFFALARSLIQKYGQPSSHDLMPKFRSRAFADWSIAGGRGAVKIGYGLEMHLTVENVQVTDELWRAVGTAQARRTAHQTAGLQVGGR